MSLILTIPDEIAHMVEEIAQRSGQTPERLLLDALRAHFPPISAELQAEFDALERASDEDLARFEQNLEEGGDATW
jgi:hypothetical protein